MRIESVFASEGTFDYASDDSLIIEELEARLKAEDSPASFLYA